MTAELNEFKVTVYELEAQLSATTVPIVRIDLIDRLLTFLVYTQPKRARKLLAEQSERLADNYLPDPQLSYHLHLAVLDNLEYRFTEAEASLARALELVEEYGTIQQRIETLIDYVGTLLNLDRQDEAENHLDKAERLLKNFPDDQLTARLLTRQGVVDLRTGRYDKAIQKYLQAFNFLAAGGMKLEIKDHYFYTLVNSGLGNVYERMGEFDKAGEAYRRAIDRCESLGMEGRLPWYYLHLGNAHLSDGDYVAAGKYFAHVLEFDDQPNNTARESAYANLGSCYIEQERYREAEELLDRAEKYFQNADRNYRSNLTTITMWRGRIKAEEGDLVGAIDELEKALEMARPTRDPIILSEICRNLADCYASTGDYESAYTAQLAYDNYQREHQEALNRRRMQELETLYRTEAKEKEAERLKLKAGHLQLNALRAQMNPHFLYNCLNSIQSFITTNNTNTASKYLAKFAMLMRQSLEYTDKDNISLEEEIAFLTDYLDISCHLRFEGKLDYFINVDEEIEEDILGVPTMIIQPYVENAIEHGLRGRKGGRIDIDFDPHSDTAILASITDNGIGREKVFTMQANDPLRSAHRSRGTEITLSRLSLLQPDMEPDATVKIIDLYDEKGEACGTRVEVVIPVVDLHLLGDKH